MRKEVVEGAVAMALEMLSKEAIVTLDEERLATTASNLPDVLCAERAAQPALNTGSLDQ